MDKRKGWGDHDMAAWQKFFDIVHGLGQVKNPVKAEDVCTNACIAVANDFDHDKVKADAMAIQLPADLAAVDIEAVKSHLFDQAIKG
jgi:NitT/TauT family transport system substrate-binding protein